jgi:hypothetical protein
VIILIQCYLIATWIRRLISWGKFDPEVADVISRVTLFSLLLGLMLAMGIRLWTGTQKDDCSRYLAGDKTAPKSEWVVTGTRTIEVSCSDWTMRQPLRVQVLCLLDVVVLLLFFLNAMADLRDQSEMRRRRRVLR